MSGKTFFHILFYTDRDYQCREVFYGDQESEKIYSLLFNNWIQEKDISTQFFLFSRKILRETFYGTEMLFHLKNFLRRKTDSIIFC